jgi:1-acyl-sn-glycerol-3-phosphate acyltransferase
LAKRGAYGYERWRSSSVDVLRNLERVGCRFEVSGLQHLRDAGGACVIVGNHMSTLETVILPSLIVPAGKATFVVKQSLVDYPVFKHVMRSRNPITVTRDNPRSDLKAVLEGGMKRLEAGVSIVIFPQTSRTRGFDPTQFNSIGSMLARRAKVSLVPLALKTDAWENGKRFKEVGRIVPSRTVHFAFGRPLRVQGKGGREHEVVVEFIRSHLDRWRAAQPE